MRSRAELIRRYLEPEHSPQPFLRVHRPGTAHRQQAGGPVQHLIHHRRDYWYGEFARRFDGKKHIATVTEHDTKQIKSSIDVSTGRSTSSMMIIAQSTGTKRATVSGQSSTRVRSGSPITVTFRLRERTTSCTHQMCSWSPMHT